MCVCVCVCVCVFVTSLSHPSCSVFPPPPPHPLTRARAKRRGELGDLSRTMSALTELYHAAAVKVRLPRAAARRGSLRGWGQGESRIDRRPRTLSPSRLPAALKGPSGGGGGGGMGVGVGGRGGGRATSEVPTATSLSPTGQKPRRERERGRGRERKQAGGRESGRVGIGWHRDCPGFAPSESLRPRAIPFTSLPPLSPCSARGAPPAALRSPPAPPVPPLLPSPFSFSPGRARRGVGAGRRALCPPAA